MYNSSLKANKTIKKTATRSQDLLQKVGNSPFSSLPRSTSLPLTTLPKSKINFEKDYIISVKSANSSPLTQLLSFNPANIRSLREPPTQKQAQGADGANAREHLSTESKKQSPELEVTESSIEYYSTSLIDQIIYLSQDDQNNIASEDGTLKLNTNEHSTTE